MENKNIVDKAEDVDGVDEALPDIPNITDELEFSEQLTALLMEEFDVLKMKNELNNKRSERDLIISTLATILYKHLIPNSEYKEYSKWGIKSMILNHIDELYYISLLKEDAGEKFIRLKPEDYSIKGVEEMECSDFFIPCYCGAPIRLIPSYGGDVTTLICMKCKKEGIRL